MNPHLLNPAVIPTGIHDDLDALAHELAASVADFHAARQRLDDLRGRAMGEASDADREAHSEAYRAKKPDPGRVNSEKVAREIQETERKIEAVRTAIDAIGDDYVAWTKANLATVEATLAERDAEDQGLLLAAIDQHRAARAQIQQRGAVMRMLTTAAAGTPKVLPAPSPAFQHLVGLNGEPVTEGALYDALLADANNVQVRHRSNMGALRPA